mmetsp:Transcript_129345/g.241980  ORF Transcript_129345/g.241980 Transcript_129345/m.241980 type:complete len:365 (-) Transcript_129345:44-1138(-)
MGAACVEVERCAEIPPRMAPEVSGRKRSVPLGASLRAASAPLRIEALWNAFNKHVAADSGHSAYSPACARAAAELADAVWRAGDAIEACRIFKEAHERCEALPRVRPGPVSDLLLAEVMLSRAITIREVGQKLPQHSLIAAAPPLSELLIRVEELAHRHELASGPQASRAALLAAVAAQNLGALCAEHGDEESARAHFEEARTRLYEARACGGTPRRIGAAPRPPRHAYLTTMQRTLQHGAMESDASAPMWWWRGGLAEAACLFTGVDLGVADAALAQRLSGSALLGNGGAEEDDMAEIAANGNKCTTETCCRAWLDFADELSENGDKESAHMFRIRTYKLAQSDASCQTSLALQRAKAKLGMP